MRRLPAGACARAVTGGDDPSVLSSGGHGALCNTPACAAARAE
jgi:hypothetical protein